MTKNFSGHFLLTSVISPLWKQDVLQKQETNTGGVIPGFIFLS